MRRSVHIAGILIFLLVTSCTHKELCYDHPHVLEVDFEFVWDESQNEFPSSMSVYLFHEYGDRPARFEFTDPEGGRIRLDMGKYDAVFVNSDTRNIRIDNHTDFDSFYITTKDGTTPGNLARYGINISNAPKAKDTDEERLAEIPETVWATSLEDIEITENNQKVILYPKKVTSTYHIEIRNPQNLKYINAVSGTLSSMSEGRSGKGGLLSENRVTIPFEGLIDRESNLITGELASFGHCPSATNTHHLVIYTVLADESWWYYTYDVTEQIHNSPDPYNIYIVLDDLPIPKPVVNGGGFKPTVGEWNSIDIEIQM